MVCGEIISTNVFVRPGVKFVQGGGIERGERNLIWMVSDGKMEERPSARYTLKHNDTMFLQNGGSHS